jgi:hypothetical protein
MEASRRRGASATCLPPVTLPHQGAAPVPQRASLAEWWMLGLIALPVACYLGGGGDGATSAVTVSVLALSVELLYFLRRGAHRREEALAATSCSERQPSLEKLRQERRPHGSEDKLTSGSDESTVSGQSAKCSLRKHYARGLHGT